MDLKVIRTYLMILLSFLILSCSGDTGDPTNVHVIPIDILQRLLRTLKSEIPPGQPNTTVVEMSVRVISLTSVSEQRMEYAASIYLRQKWEDPALAKLLSPTPDYFPDYLKAAHSYIIPINKMRSIWRPDPYFKNEKRSIIHSTTQPNVLMLLRRTGEIFYVLKISLVLNCHMCLATFPHDEQVCNMEIQSYSYNSKSVTLKWFDDHDHRVEMDEHIKMSKFEIKAVNTSDCSQTYLSGHYPCLRVSFTFHRNFGFYLTQIYIPSTLIVILSWIGFWISYQAVPARVTLGLLTVLTMTTLRDSTLKALPQVSYLKALDVWMAACLISVVFALLEFAIINFSSHRSVSELSHKMFGLSPKGAHGRKVMEELLKAQGGAKKFASNWVHSFRSHRKDSTNKARKTYCSLESGKLVNTSSKTNIEDMMQLQCSLASPEPSVKLSRETSSFFTINPDSFSEFKTPDQNARLTYEVTPMRKVHQHPSQSHFEENLMPKAKTEPEINSRKTKRSQSLRHRTPLNPDDDCQREMSNGECLRKGIVSNPVKILWNTRNVLSDENPVLRMCEERTGQRFLNENDNSSFFPEAETLSQLKQLKFKKYQSAESTLSSVPKKHNPCKNETVNDNYRGKKFTSFDTSTETMDDTNTARKILKSHRKISKIDTVSRFLFPGIFILFSILYFCIYVVFTENTEPFGQFIHSTGMLKCPTALNHFYHEHLDTESHDTAIDR